MRYLTLAPTIALVPALVAVWFQTPGLLAASCIVSIASTITLGRVSSSSSR